MVCLIFDVVAWCCWEAGMSHHSDEQLGLNLNLEQLNCSPFDLDRRNLLLHASQGLSVTSVLRTARAAKPFFPACSQGRQPACR